MFYEVFQMFIKILEKQKTTIIMAIYGQNIAKVVKLDSIMACYDDKKACIKEGA